MQWTSKFSHEFRQVAAETFTLSEEALKAVSDIKAEIGITLWHSVDETIPLVVGTDTADYCIAVIVN